MLLAASPLCAQTAPAPSEPPLRRWFEFQTFTVYSRYRFIENSAGRTTSSQGQYKDAIRARVNLDAQKNYTINFGYFSGGSFISTWNNWGVGTGDFNGRDHYLKQLYVSAAPIEGLELQYGGLYVTRGENDDITTYDEDGYLVGGRASVRRPKMLYFDEIGVTRGAIGPFNQPSVFKRWDGAGHPNYVQVLVAKRLLPFLSSSLDYSAQSGAETIRAAATLRFDKTSLFRTVRYEQYRRVTSHPASGFSVWAEQSLGAYLRLQWGYATVDQRYSGWNADRFQSGRRFFGIATVPIRGPLSLSVFATHALPSAYPITLKRRFDAVVSYDVLASLRQTGIF